MAVQDGGNEAVTDHEVPAWGKLQDQSYNKAKLSRTHACLYLRAIAMPRAMPSNAYMYVCLLKHLVMRIKANTTRGATWALHTLFIPIRGMSAFRIAWFRNGVFRI